MHKLFKSLVCVITAVVIFVFSVVTIPTSANTEITPEQEILIYCADKGYEQGIPYLPSWFQSFSGWSANKSKWETFISNSIYENRIYVSYVFPNGQVYLYIYNYDNINLTHGYDFTFDNCTWIWLVHNTSDVMSVSNQGSQIVNYKGVITSNYSGDPAIYVNISLNGQSLILDDTTVLYESINESKDKGITSGLGKLLSGGFSLMDNSLLEVNSEDFQLLGSLVSGQIAEDLSLGLGVDVEVGDDTYNSIVTDLTNNTTNSSYWSQIDTSTQNSIRNTYSNLKNSFDNSVKVYNNDARDYYYMPSTTVSSNDSYPNYSTYVSNGGNIADYFNTYIKSNVSSDGGDVTTVPSGNGSSNNGGAYAEANANAEINQGDIVINVPSSSGDSSDSSSSGGQDFDDVDTSTLESLFNSCNNFIIWVGKVLSVFPPEIIGCFAGLLTVVIACRILGR